MRQSTLLVLALALLALAAGAWFGAREAPPPALETATLLGEGRALPAFELRDGDGQPFANEQLAGGWTLMFFGFTHCPDVCPVTLATLAAVTEKLETQGVEAPRVAFVTVDPERDTPAVAARYAKHFDGDFRGLSGDAAEIEKLAAALGIVYVKVPVGGAGGYTMDHGTSVLLLGPDARWRGVFGAPHEAEPMTRDLAKILTGAGPAG